MKRLLLGSGILLGLGLAAAALAIGFGGPGAAPPPPSMDDPFKAVDFSDLPPVSRYTARDGASLAYRNYPPAGTATPRKGSILLLHGSAATS